MNKNVNQLTQYLRDNNTQMLKMNVILFYLQESSVTVYALYYKLQETHNKENNGRRTV